MVAVQVDQALEGFLFAAGEEPVDRAVFVGLEVLLVEPAGQVAAERVLRGFALFGVEARGQEGEVGIKVFGGPATARNCTSRLAASSRPRPESTWARPLVSSGTDSWRGSCDR